MKKETAAAVLLLTMAAGAVYNIFYLNKLTGEILYYIELSQKSGQLNEPDAAEQYAKSALEIWLNAEEYTHVMIRHSEIDGTTDAFYELLSAIEADEDGKSYCYDKLTYHIKSIRGMDHVTFGSIM